MLDVPIEYQWDEMKVGNFHPEELRNIFNELQFRQLSTRVFNELLPQQPTSSAVPDLFTPVTEITTNQVIADEAPLFKTFDTVSHEFEAVTEMPALESGHLFFEWILNEGRIAGFAFAAENGNVYYHLLENEHHFYKELISSIFNTERTIVTYNSKQTYKFLFQLKNEPKAHFFDLQIAHYLMQPEISHLLPLLSENYLQYKMIEEGKKENPDVSELVRRTIEKVEVYRQLFPIFDKELNDNNLTHLFNDIEVPLAPILAKMEVVGMHLDTHILEESSAQLNEDVAALEKRIFELAGAPFNIGSPKQLGEVLFEKLRIIENAKLTKTKQYQTGEEILLKLANRHEIVPLILEWRGLSKLKSTYIDALPLLVNPKTGRIHSTFNQTVTSTGRLSSTNPNLQNIPIRTQRGKDIRKAFTPEAPDSVILSADYSQIELRIVAAVSGDEEMTAAFKEHRDIHAMTAAKVYGVPLDEVTPDMRRTAKTVNFGILYGISAFGLAERLYISQKEARDLIAEYYRSFPKIILYLDGATEFARTHGYVETLLHRRRYIRDIGSSNAILRKAAERNAINAPIQGTAADLIKIAMIRVDAEMSRRQLKSRMILQIHDELVFEVPQDEIETMKQLVTETMNDAMTMAVPLETEVNYGKSWYDAH